MRMFGALPLHLMVGLLKSSEEVRAQQAAVSANQQRVAAEAARQMNMAQERQHPTIDGECVEIELVKLLGNG